MQSGSGGAGAGGQAGGHHHHQTYQEHQQQQQQQQSSANNNKNQTANEQPDNQRSSSLIHDSEVFLTKLREFKPQSLGCLEARRKSSSTLIFPCPQQACMGPPKCPLYPHNVKPTTGYWIECHGPGVLAPSKQASSSQQQTADAGSDAGNQDHDDLRATNASCQPMSPKLVMDKCDSATRRQSGGSAATDGQVHQGQETSAPPRRRQSSSGQQQLSISLQQLSEQLEQSVSLEGTDATKAEAQQQATKRAAGRLSTSVSIRRKMNKRTMTRDDIDLHKTRRGTPNITITEASFNQSTTSPFSLNGSSASSAATAAPCPSQASTRQKSSRGPDAEIPNKQDDDEQSQKAPVKFQIQRYASVEQQQQQSAKQSRGSVEHQESTGGGDFAPPETADRPQQSGQTYHRPSIIREDTDTTEGEHSQQPQAKSQQRELYCGLSTTNFNKKPLDLQQHHHHHHQQQQQHSSSSQQQQSGNSDANNNNNNNNLQATDARPNQKNFEQFKDSSLELISFEEENYEKHYYGREHWNYFTNDELLGPVMLSLKQEVNNQRDHFHVLLRTVSYTLHGTIPASTICADRYDREAIVRELSEIAKLKPPLMLGQLPSTPDELLKLDHIFIKTELKVGVIYIKQGQEESEEAILGNKDESPLFSEFLDLLGDRITLKGFDRYKGGLDTVHNLTGTESVYTTWRNIEIMFHVSTMLPHEENDPQKLQKKRHIGNDIVCVAFIESDDTLFWPGCIKSYFLHTFIAIQTSPKPVKEGEKRKYRVSCVCRNEVQYAFRPYLVEQDEFYKSDYFREWLLVKIVNGERASYSAPKFARMQDRTRSQLLEDIITNLANHLVTGQIPKPYRRGSWRPLGHTRASSPLEDSMKDYFEDYDQLAKDFCNAFCGPNKSVLCDVAFKVKDSDGTFKLVHGVRAILAIRSRTFLEMLYGFVPPGTGGTTGLQNQTSLRAIEMKALSGESSSGAGGKDSGSGEQHTKSLLAKRGSVGTDPSRKISEKERRQSMLPNLSKSVHQKPNYLTVPSTGGGGAGGAGSSGGAGPGGMIKNAFNRLVSGNWSGWSGNIKGYKGEPMHIKVDQNKTKVDLNSLAICKEIAKIDADKLTQTEFEIKEFDYETFQQTIEYIHNGQCKLSYKTIPGLICAAEHYDLPDLLHACFHHANTHLRLSAAPKMMNALYQSSCFYITAMQLLDSIYEYIDPHGTEFFNRSEYLELYESVFTALLSRKTLQVSELGKFQAMDSWAKQQVANKLQKQQLQRQLQLQRKQSAEQHQHQQQQATSTEQQHQAHMVPEQASLDQQQEQLKASELMEQQEYRNLTGRLNKEINIKLEKISNEDLVRWVLPKRVFSNDKIFEVMADESRNDY